MSVLHHIRGISLLFCVISVFAFGQLQSAAAGDGQSGEAERIALTSEGKTVEVHPLDAWENPYRGQYGEWDQWIWEHYDPTITFADIST